MDRLLQAYAGGGATDPADLFALYSAFDAAPVRLNRVLAQVLSALLDQQILRVFEYLGAESALAWGRRGGGVEGFSWGAVRGLLLRRRGRAPVRRLSGREGAADDSARTGPR